MEPYKEKNNERIINESIEREYSETRTVSSRRIEASIEKNTRYPEENFANEEERKHNFEEDDFWKRKLRPMEHVQFINLLIVTIALCEWTAIGKKDSTLSIAFVKDSFCNNLYIPDSKISNEKKKYAQIVISIITKNFYYSENLIRNLAVPIILSFVNEKQWQVYRYILRNDD